MNLFEDLLRAEVSAFTLTTWAMLCCEGFENSASANFDPAKIVFLKVESVRADTTKPKFLQ